MSRRVGVRNTRRGSQDNAERHEERSRRRQARAVTSLRIELVLPHVATRTRVSRLRPAHRHHLRRLLLVLLLVVVLLMLVLVVLLGMLVMLGVLLEHQLEELLGHPGLMGQLGCPGLGCPGNRSKY